jgi:hypothetical protein
VLPHPVNFFTGWGLILAGFVSGAVLGIWFYREDFLGGYASFRRRILRLGHVALVAMGMINILFALSPLPAPGQVLTSAASTLLIIGGIAMPMTCMLTGWRPSFRKLFPVAVSALLMAVIFTLIGAVQ